jgi:aspartate oxidase
MGRGSGLVGDVNVRGQLVSGRLCSGPGVRHRRVHFLGGRRVERVQVGRVDRARDHIHDTLVGGDNLGDPRLVRNFVYGSPFYLDILLDNGLRVLPSLTRPGGHYGYRTYTTEHGVGADIVQIQKQLCDKAGVEFLLDTKMTQIYEGTNQIQRMIMARQLLK